MTTQELKEKFGLEPGDVLTFPNHPQFGYTLISYHYPTKKCIAVALVGNYNSEMLGIEKMMAYSKGVFEVHKIAKSIPVLSVVKK